MLFLFSRDVVFAEVGIYQAAPMTIVRVPGSPAELLRCQMNRNSPETLDGTVVVQNRTRHQLSDIRVTFTAYDVEGVKMDVTQPIATPTELVGPGDNAPYKIYAIFSLKDQSRFFARATCRISSAQFSGYVQPWTTLRRWTEKLLPLANAESSDTTQPDRSVATSRKPNGPAASPVAIHVTNAWNDVVAGKTLVHVAIDTQGGNSDSTLTPEHLVLTMALASGGKKTYTAIPVAAPTYEMVNPLLNATKQVHEVDPKEDLGGLGSVIVPAHGTVKVVATFLVGTDVVANASDNRNVVLK